ncbi:MAG: amidohydrolase [Chloroflexota bacterium]|nr:amidohydrolase [Chloroflexota bacterium]
MIVDVHAHYHPRAYQDALEHMPGWGGPRGFGGARFPDSDAEDQVQRRLEMMDAAGVGQQVLSPAAGWAPYAADQRSATAAARVINDRAADLVGRVPARFLALVALPLPHIDAALVELRRGLDELGMVGVNLHCSALDRSLAEPEFLPLYQELQRRRAVVLFHPTGNGICSPFITEYGLNSAVGTSLEDAAIGLHLVARRIPAQCPDITFIIPHLGGPLPMLLQRLDNQFSMRERELPEPPSATLRRFYYDTVGHGSQAALWCAVTAFGADHVLPGSDFPVLLAFESYARTFAWIREAGLPSADVEQILERSAPTALGLSQRS